MSRSFPCRRCGAVISVPDAAATDPSASLVCPGCGLRYSKKRPSATAVGAASAGGPTAAGYTAPPSPSLAAASAISLGETRAEREPSIAATTRPIFAAGDFVANRYRVVRFVARGGMGEVYEAEDLDLRGRVALKTLHAGIVDTEIAVERFKREIQLARRVTHPNVCRIFDVGYHGTAGDSPLVFLSMELLEGETLAARLRRSGRMTPAAALPIARQLADALAAAHEAGVVHRDFKSENVFLVPGRDGERAVVTDFGIARAAPDARFAATLTGDGSAIGTPAYMAPEQIEGRTVTPASDQYAFGVVLFEMVTGELPFRGDNPLATAARRLTEAAPSPRGFAPDLDDRWEGVILRCLARRPEERFRDVRAAARALVGEAFATATSADESAVGSRSEAPARSAGARRPVTRGDRRKRWLAAVLLAALAGASFWAWQRVREIRTRLEASAPVLARRSVAVLEPRNLSGRPESAWLGTALAEMLASEVAQSEALRVLPGDGVARAVAELGLSGNDRLGAADRGRVRRRLGADALVVGGYTALPGGAGLRVDLRLEDARSNETLATLSESGSEAELFALVRRLGATLRRALGASAAASARAALPTSPEAARLYSEGLEAVRAFDTLRGRDLLARAVAAAPDNALARSALASAWATLGYRARALEEGRKAVDLASGLAVEERLVVEARYFETALEWAHAADTWQRLWTAYPDMLPYGLRLASSRLAAGDPERALATALALRNLPPPDGEDPRIDLAEAAAAGALGDFPRQAEAAGRAVERAEAEGAGLLAAEARLARGVALRQLGRLAEAGTAFERAREAFEDAGNRAGVFEVDSAWGSLLLEQGQPEAARTAFLRTHAQARELGDRGAEATALNNLAVLARTRGENEPARAGYEQVLAIFEETGNRGGAAFAANNLAVCLTELGDFDAAETRVATALATWRENGDRVNLPSALGTQGGVARRLGRFAEAERLWREALAMRRETRHRAGEAVALSGLAQTQFERGDLEAADESFRSAAALARELGAKGLLAAALAGGADVAAARGDAAASLAAASESLGLRRELGDRVGVARSRLAIAELDLAGDPRAAQATAVELVGSPAGSLPPDVEADARLLLARTAAALGDARSAREALATEDLVGRLSAAQRLRWRLAEAYAAEVGGRRVEARAIVDAARDEARRLGARGAELECELAAAELAGVAPSADFVRRAREAGFEGLARRAETRPR